MIRSSTNEFGGGTCGRALEARQEEKSAQIRILKIVSHERTKSWFIGEKDRRGIQEYSSVVAESASRKNSEYYSINLGKRLPWAAV
jgi:hypothetical protein